MASGDPVGPAQSRFFPPNNRPFIGAIQDCFRLCWSFMKYRTFGGSDALYIRDKSPSKHTCVLVLCCLLVGLVSNIKLEVMMFDDSPLPNDMHIILMSNEENLYIDEIDPTRMTCCVEASDIIVLLISCIFIVLSKKARSPVSEYLFLPWLGMSLRGVLTRQIPTVGAYIYTIAVIDNHINLLFLTNFITIFVLECRIWLDIVRLLRGRWERKYFESKARFEKKLQVETLWSCGETDSVEMQNFVY